MSGFPPNTSETSGSVLRRQLSRADVSNPWTIGLYAPTPTMTLGAAFAASQITNPVDYGPATSSFVWLGSRSDNLINGYVVPSSTTYSATSRLGGRMAAAVCTDAADLEFVFQTGGGSGTYRVLVNGQYVTAAARTTGAPGGQNFRDRFTFAATGDKEIEIEMDASVRFGGITVGQNDSVWAPNIPAPTFFAFTDSFGEPTGNAIVAGGWTDLFGRQLGYRRRWISGAGGTSLVSNGSNYSFVQRLMDLGLCTDLANIKHVHVQGSMNDNAMSGVSAAALTMFQGIRTQCPTAIISASGALNMSNSNIGDMTNRDALKTVLATISGPTFFIDNIADAWTNASGSINRYKWSDGVHPGAAGASGQLGHQFLADRHMPDTRSYYGALN